MCTNTRLKNRECAGRREDEVVKELDDIVHTDEAAAVEVEVCLIALDFRSVQVLEQGDDIRKVESTVSVRIFRTAVAVEVSGR